MLKELVINMNKVFYVWIIGLKNLELKNVLRFIILLGLGFNMF